MHMDNAMQKIRKCEEVKTASFSTQIYLLHIIHKHLSISILDLPDMVGVVDGGPGLGGIDRGDKGVDLGYPVLESESVSDPESELEACFAVMANSMVVLPVMTIVTAAVEGAPTGTSGFSYSDEELSSSSHFPTEVLVKMQ
ncbi:unnamed protein product [Thlaspi arvense]|uniref:Uncharacterized protein n=1 Tax=Thlaspi arvense TaxID=13288 RepID=A0AAU9T9C5_THLAR|nr:unnamed protein product [Thlaspi arvense]